MNEITTTAPKGKVDLAALGCYSAGELADSAFARVLLVGPPKAGKTTALATGPLPLIINCDGANACKGAANHCGQEFLAFDVLNAASFKRAVDNAAKLVAAGEVKSIVVDTLTLLADNVLDDLKVKGFDGFNLWNEFDSSIRVPLKRLLTLDAHVFATAHLDGGSDEKAGILPLFPGSGKRKIAGMFSDWIMMTYQPGLKPERQFILSGSNDWHGNCRNYKKVDVCDATVPSLFKALGIPL